MPPTIVRTPIGGVAARDEYELELGEAVGEAPAPDVGVQLRAAQLDEERREGFDTLGNKALTFAEGVVDAATLGLVHEHGEKADIRRDVNAGSALTGQLLGTALGMKLPIGPVRSVVGVSERAGRGAAHLVLSEAQRGRALGQMLTRGAEEAAIGAGLMGSTAVGHQVSDAIVEDKALAGEVILHEMGLGAALGFGAGALSGGFKVLASRGDIRAQGGFVDPASPQSRGLVDEVKAVRDSWRDAAGVYDARVGVLKEQAALGVIPSELVESYATAAKAARKAVDRLEEYSIAQMMDAGPKEFGRFRKDLYAARRAIDDAGDVFRAPPSEARPQRFTPEQGRDLGLPNEVMPTGQAPSMGLALDEVMERGGVVGGEIGGRGALNRLARGVPEQPRQFLSGDKLRADYERIYGRPYEPYRASMDDAIAGRVDDVAGAEAGTVANKPRRAPALVDDADSAYSPPKSGEFTRVEPEGIPTRVVDNRATAVSGPPEFQVPSVAAEQNAAAFAQFRERAVSEVEPFVIGADRVGVPRQEWARTAKDPGVPRGEPLPGPAKTVKDPNVPRGEAPAADRTYKDPGVPRGEPLPKEAVVDDATRAVEDGTTVRPKPSSPEWDEFKRRAAENYVEKWYWDSVSRGRRINPADEAAARLDSALREISSATGGRLNSAGALEVGERLGLKPIPDAFVERLDQIWALRKAAKFAADEARGVKTALGVAQRGVIDEIARRYMARMGAAIVGNEFGGPLGGAAGWVLGKHAAGMMGFGARTASAAGRVTKMAVKTGESLLRGRRASVAARAVAGNRAYAYDADGPVQDPTERIRKLHQLAQDPDGIRLAVRKQLGDAALAAPDIATHAEEAAVRRVTNLSLRAPVIYFDQLGRSIAPAAGEFRKFFEYENATHDLPGLLHSIATGAVTPTQISALTEQHAAVHAIVTRTILSDPEALKSRPTAALRNIEAILGIPLTIGSVDPGHVARVQEAYIPKTPPTGPQAPQAFKIPDPPTPAQAGATAPGNQ